jgi:hypothetical protein
MKFGEKKIVPDAKCRKLTKLPNCGSSGQTSQLSGPRRLS